MNTQHKKRKFVTKMQQGFSLIELLVVLVIIGAILALILPNTFRAIREANEKTCQSHHRSVISAVALCYSDTRDYGECSTVAALLTGNYLDADPICPIVDSQITGVNSSDAGISPTVSTDHWPNWPVLANDDHIDGGGDE